MLVYFRVALCDQAGIHSNRQPLPQRNWPTNRMSKFTEKLTAYDSAVALMGNEEIAFVMAAACKTGNAAYMVKALSVVARAKLLIKRILA